MFCATNGGEDDLGQVDCKEGKCCRPATAVNATPATPAAGGGVAPPPGTLFAAIQSVNPATLACIKTGDCSVDDIVYAGVGFAKFLMGLSGALFFIIFIYGGALYLMSFGDKARVDKGKKAITGAAIGIVIVAGAWTIVQYIVGGITGIEVKDASAPAAQTIAATPCTNLFKDYSCKTFFGADAASALLDCQTGNDCKPGLCPGSYNIICAKTK